MIKEKKKRRDEFQNKSFGQKCVAYIKTVLISFCVALFITTMLTLQARHEMIKNVYISPSSQRVIDKNIAQYIIDNSDPLNELEKERYSVCLQVGNLYQMIGDYTKAQQAYEIAIRKSKNGVYTAYEKLASILIAQEKFDEANALLDSIFDVNNKALIKCKTRAYIEMGDKYYSIGKTIKASRCYEQALFYYNKFSKKDKVVEEAIIKRLIKSYEDTADIIVKKGYNSDAVKYLNKARSYAPYDYKLQYKLAIVYADLDPIKSIEYFEPLFGKMPQNIDYSVYSTALMKAANIYDLQGESVKAKYCRYKVHSIDLFTNNKVVYKDDVDIFIKHFSIKKMFFQYHMKAIYKVKNISSSDISKLYMDFVLRQGDKIKEIYIFECATKEEPILSNGSESQDIEVKFGKNIYTKKELNQYDIDIYVYKDKKFKTLYGTFKIPEKSF